MPVAAFIQGVLGASSLVIGALLGVFWKPRRVVSAAIMAFGSGTLLAAIAFEITLPVYSNYGSLPLLIGYLLGGGLFVGLTQYIDQHGGFLRKPASSRRYFFEHHSDKSKDVLSRISHIEVMQNMPEIERKALVPLLKYQHVRADEVICQEGSPGEYFYLIVSGEAEVRKDSKILSYMGPGEVFGEMALLTGEPRSATIISHTPMELYLLHKKHFGKVLSWSPHMAWALSRSLARRLRLATDSRVVAEKNLDRWRQQLVDQVELDILMREEPSILAELAKNSAPLAILIGTLIDNVPEATVIGMNVGNSHLGWSFLLAVFISNFPEALSSAAGMKRAGTSRSQIICLWVGIVLLSGIVAAIAYSLQSHTPDWFVALTQATAGGAILAMLASTMMPEAYELGGGYVSFSTIVGFLLGVFVSGHELY
ncbi:MAG: cyclic nucleotide-binding domain-containing protein [Okeania sp. SIO2D1]|nr:cyclic nucleotide-binding domain-containing protein [Okeania sp. SIO2D1]